MIEFMNINQNPGDLVLPDGWEPIPKKRVLILGIKAEKVDRTEFDDIVPLRGSSVNGDEEQVLAETTYGK